MAISSKPDAVPTWASSDVIDPVGGANVIEPPAGKKTNGWAWLEKPAYNWMNWLFRKSYQWINYFNQFFSATHQFQINEIVEYDVGNGVGIEQLKILDYKLNGTYYINTQAGFNAIIENVAGSQYQFVDDVVSVVFDNLSGGYQMPASGAGYLETNNCKSIEMRGGAFFDFNAGIGYVSVNTDDCYLRNVHVQGNGSTGAVVQSFLLGANRVTFDNCKCSNRLSSVDMVGFQGSGTALHNITSKYNNCSAYTLAGTDKVYGFKGCSVLSNCIAYDLDSSTGPDQVFGFNGCGNLMSCHAYNIISDSQTAAGFLSCSRLSLCTAVKIDSDSGSAIGFGSSGDLSSCYVDDIDSNSSNAKGFNACSRISSCRADNIGSASGTASGFDSCSMGSSLYTAEAVNGGNDWMDTDDVDITRAFSCSVAFT